jgi:hypothetical protein
MPAANALLLHGSELALFMFQVCHKRKQIANKNAMTY